MTRDEIVEERRRLKAEYRELFADVAALLFRHDPIGINFDTNTDEYEPEVGTILPRLRTCRSEEDTLQVVHEEFIHWFGSEIGTSRDKYAKIAAEIWQLWQAGKTLR
jgi:hypothetical protein